MKQLPCPQRVEALDPWHTAGSARTVREPTQRVGPKDAQGPRRCAFHNGLLALLATVRERKAEIRSMQAGGRERGRREEELLEDLCYCRDAAANQNATGHPCPWPVPANTTCRCTWKGSGFGMGPEKCLSLTALCYHGWDVAGVTWRLRFGGCASICQDIPTPVLAAVLPYVKCCSTFAVDPSSVTSILTLP